MNSVRSRLLLAGVATLLLLILLAIYFGLPGPPAKNSRTDNLSIATPSVPHAALLYIATAKGYFAEESLEVTLMPTIHGKAAVELVVQGKADLGAASEVVFVVAAAKGEAVAIAANMFSSAKDLAVVARSDRGIAEPHHLMGKRIGTTLGTASDYFLWSLLIRHKLPPESITLVNMLPSEMAQAIEAGTIDAASSWQPNVLNMQRALGNKGVTFQESLAYMETFNIIGRREFLKANSQAIEKLLRALLKAEQFNQAYPNEALALVAARLNTEISVIRPAWREFNFRVDLRQSQMNTLEEESRWAMARGYIANRPTPNFLPNLYLDALLAVEPERVTVMR